MELLSKISFFLHILSAMLIAVSVFGFSMIESAFGREMTLSLHKLSLKFSNLARNGGLLALITGIYNWFAIGNIQGWLIVKVILFIWFVISGVFVGVKYISKREKLLSEGQTPADEMVKVNKIIKVYSRLNLIIFILIVFLAVFRPF